MFRESLLENYSDREHRRGWATLISFLAQCALVCVAVALPLLYPEVMPMVRADSHLLMPPPSGGPPRPPQPEPLASHNPNPAPQENPLIIHQPPAVPAHIDTSPDPQVASAVPTGEYVIGSTNGGPNLSPVLQDILRHTEVRPVVRQAQPTSVRMSPGVSQGLLISRIEPRYPDIERKAHIQGDVILAAVIGRDGMIENLHVVSGHPLLTQAALQAVKQWRYQPYRLGTEAVEVETQVTVRFRLNSLD